MRVLQLNVWNGRIKGSILRFLSEHEYDVICLQEAVWTDAEYAKQLDFFVDTADAIKKASGLEYDERVSNWGISILDGHAIMQQGNVILSRYPIESVETKCLSGEFNEDINFVDYEAPAEALSWNALKVKLENGLTVLCHHGYWQPNPIGNEETIVSTQKLADMVRDEDGPVIVCADMNIAAESPAMRALDFLRDLTAENDVKSTLQYLKLKLDIACGHILISDGIEYENFCVHENIISDHRAASVDINF